jgi:hypothetical protein
MIAHRKVCHKVCQGRMRRIVPLMVRVVQQDPRYDPLPRFQGYPRATTGANVEVTATLRQAWSSGTRVIPRVVARHGMV